LPTEDINKQLMSRYSPLQEDEQVPLLYSLVTNRNINHIQSRVFRSETCVKVEKQYIQVIIQNIYL